MHTKGRMNLSVVRKMAAKKGAQIQFQTEVSNDEEWNKLLERTGLIVIDVYSEWCGPCTAMVSSLKKLKLEIGSDCLHFALVKASTIGILERFQNKSEPTWMFVAGGHLVNLMFGVDAPSLIQLIKIELEKEMNVLQQKSERKWIPFNELTEAEIKREAALARKREIKLIEEQQKIAQKMNTIRERSLLKLAKMMPTHSCILYFPYMIAADGSCAIAQKMMYLNDSISTTVVDQIQIQLNAKMIEQVFYKCPVFVAFNECAKKKLLEKPSLVTLLQVIIIEEFSDLVSPRPPRMDYDLCIEKKLSKIVYGCEDPTYYTEQSVAYEFIVEHETGDKLPPMWTPTNPLSKAAAIEILFPRKVESIGYVNEELPPPQLIIIYDAVKVRDILDLIKAYRSQVYRMGFFDSVDPYNAKLLCTTYEQFSKLSDEETKNVKVVVALRKGNNEDLLLEFSQVIPLYISPNEKIGTEESEIFFPYDYCEYEGDTVNVEDKDTSNTDEEDKKDINTSNIELTETL